MNTLCSFQNECAKVIKIFFCEKSHLLILKMEGVVNSESLDFRLFVEKNEKKYRVCYTIEFFCIFAVTKSNGPLAQLNRVFDYGSKGYRFESCRGHEKKTLNIR